MNAEFSWQRLSNSGGLLSANSGRLPVLEALALPYGGALRYAIFPEKKELVKPTFRIMGSLALAIVCAVAFSSCGQEAARENATSVAPLNELDLKINAYEKVANEYGRVARKLKAGDVSLTIRYLDLAKRTRETAAKLAQESPQMSPPQAQRVAGISARTLPYFQ